MGWGILIVYFELARVLSHRTLFPVIVGGTFYSAGAVLNVMGQPVLWPGIFESHDLFHMMVLAGSAVHYWFIATVIVPLDPATLTTATFDAPRSRESRFEAEASIFRLDPRVIADLRLGSLSSRGGMRPAGPGQAA